MDLLKRELERKKKSVQKAKSASGGRRFFRASDLRKQEEEEEEDAKQAEWKARRKHKRNEEEEEDAKDHKKSRHDTSEKGTDDASGTKETDKTETNDDPNKTDSDAHHVNKLSPEEMALKLRAFGYPVRLFGETLADRWKRLRKALDDHKNVQASNEERGEFQLGRGHGIRNPFLEKDNKANDNKEEEHVEENNPSQDKKEEEEDDPHTNLDDESDPHKRVYKYFKGLCKQWEEDLNQRPEAAKRSVAGRNDIKTFKQCKDYIRPMFKLLKNRRMDEGILTKLNKIVTFCLQEEFVKAHDTYIDISIGRAAWPIGVTMVGIHARTGRAKIESSNVAHVMNSELQRKYLTSCKRLMTFAQKKSSADPSKMVR